VEFSLVPPLHLSHRTIAHAGMAVEIFLIPRDDESARTWQHRTKDFRLFALKTAPEAFLSTYEREVAFADDVWYTRITNPQASTFVALQESRIVGSLVLIGPLPYVAEDHSPRENPWLPPSTTATSPAKEPAVSHWRVNGMFVLPEVRRQGTAGALIEKSMAFGQEQAALSGKEFVASIAVDDDNPPAKRLYEKCGFVTIKSEPLEPDSPRRILLMKYMPRVGESI
jgi:GNAT superfamily N-acetyltransferase